MVLIDFFVVFVVAILSTLSLSLSLFSFGLFFCTKDRKSFCLTAEFIFVCPTFHWIMFYISVGHLFIIIIIISVFAKTSTFFLQAGPRFDFHCWSLFKDFFSFLLIKVMFVCERLVGLESGRGEEDMRFDLFAINFMRFHFYWFQLWSQLGSFPVWPSFCFFH